MKWIYNISVVVWCILAIVNWYSTRNILLGNTDFIIAIGFLILATLEERK